MWIRFLDSGLKSLDLEPANTQAFSSRARECTPPGLYCRCRSGRVVWLAAPSAFFGAWMPPTASDRKPFCSYFAVSDWCSLFPANLQKQIDADNLLTLPAQPLSIRPVLPCRRNTALSTSPSLCRTTSCL